MSSVSFPLLLSSALAATAAALAVLAVRHVLRQGGDRSEACTKGSASTAGQPLAIRLEDAVLSLADGFALFDRNCRLICCNEAYRAAYPLIADRLIPGAVVHDLVGAIIDRGNVMPAEEASEAWMAERFRHPLASDEPTESRLEDGRWYRIRQQRTSRGDVLRLLVDITDTKRREQGIRRAEKMEAVARLAGGLAHDFNNLMTGIGGFTELARRQLHQPVRVAESLDQIMRNVNRATGLTKQLLAFSPGTPGDTKVIGVGNAVQGVAGLIRPLLCRKCELHLQLADRNTPIEIDAAQFDQALIHLALNARDAMPDGGLLTVTTRLVELDEEFVRAHRGRHAGLHAVVTVKDTGIGMDEKTVANAFEPFFTTKRPGVGVGLAMVYGFAQRMGGMVTLDSAPGCGCSVSIYLPRSTRLPANDDPALAAPPRGTVMVVDDEAPVRDFVAIALQDQGYDVMRADTPESALEQIEHANVHVDLVVTDVMMPRMNGAELARRIGKRHPHVKVVFMSGYENRLPAEKRVLRSGAPCLFKPFSQETLRTTVQRAVAADATEAVVLEPERVVTAPPPANVA